MVGERTGDGKEKHDADNQRAKRAKQAKAERSRKNQVRFTTLSRFLAIDILKVDEEE